MVSGIVSLASQSLCHGIPRAIAPKSGTFGPIRGTVQYLTNGQDHAADALGDGSAGLAGRESRSPNWRGAPTQTKDRLRLKLGGKIRFRPTHLMRLPLLAPRPSSGCAPRRFRDQGWELDSGAHFCHHQEYGSQRIEGQ